jgi:hypothetical protein
LARPILPVRHPVVGGGRWAVAAALLLLAAPGLSALELEVGSEGLVVSGATAGAEVAVFGLTRDSVGFQTRTWEVGEVVTADGSGVAVHELGRPVPPLAVFVAVDLASGESVVGSPGGPLAAEPLPLGSLSAGSANPEEIEVAGPLVSALVWRSGVSPGAWWLTVGDGGVDDLGGEADGRLVFRVDQLRRLDGGGTVLTALASGDGVVLIDPETLAVRRGTVGSGAPPDSAPEETPGEVPDETPGGPGGSPSDEPTDSPSSPSSPGGAR